MNTPQPKPTYKVVCAKPDALDKYFDTRESAEYFAETFNAQMNRSFPALADDYRCTVEEVTE